MNKYIEQALKSVKICDVPEFSESDTKIVIPKKAVYTTSQMQVGTCYILELEDYLLRPSNTFNYHNDWNGGLIPTHKWYKCECINKVGNNIKISGVGYNRESNEDTMDMWEGWLPLKSIKVIGRL